MLTKAQTQKLLAPMKKVKSAISSVDNFRLMTTDAFVDDFKHRLCVTKALNDIDWTVTIKMYGWSIGGPRTLDSAIDLYRRLEPLANWDKVYKALHPEATNAER